MSALVSSRLPMNPAQRSALAATREISRVTSSATRYDRGIEAILSILLSVPGVCRVVIEAPPDLAEPLNFDRIGRAAVGASGSAVAQIEAAHRSWGQLRIFFELISEFGTNPVRLTQYAAQQIAGMLERLWLLHQRKVLHRQITTLKRRLDTRKAVARAIGLIGRSENNVSREASLAQLAALARRHHRTLLPIAQSIIFLEGEGGSFGLGYPPPTIGNRNNRLPTWNGKARKRAALS